MSDQSPLLNSNQRDAVEHREGPLLIIAGAGTGKTTVITEKIFSLITGNFAAAEEILALTFTEKAAGEMEERVDTRLPYGYLDLHISTFHSFAQKLLERHGLDIGLPADFKVLDETATWMLVRENLKKFNLDYYRPLGNPTKFIHSLLKHFSRCKDELIAPTDYLAHAESLHLDADVADSAGNFEHKRIQEIANAYHVYNQLLLENKSVDFGDLIFYLIKLFKERPNILEHYRTQFKYILVDEFQDTNWAQYELIKMIASPRNNLTVVGDDDQSIFRFRGASVSNILQFKKDFPASREVVLTQNYRSPQAILDAAYALIQHNNPDRLECKLEGLNKKLVAHSTVNPTLIYIPCATKDEELNVVVGKIRELQASTGCAWSECAVLVRTNAHAEPLLRALRRAQVPAHFVAASGLFKQELVLDALAFLSVIHSHHESASLYRVLHYPVFTIPQTDIQQLMYWCGRKNWSLWYALHNAEKFEISAGGRAALEKISTLIRTFSERAKKEKASDLLFSFFDESGYLAFLAHEEEALSPHWIEQIGYVRMFFDYILEFEETAPEPTVRAFLAYHAYHVDAGDEGSLPGTDAAQTDAVTILTVHRSKGLEFDHVFITNMIEGRFPSQDRAEAIAIPDALVKEVLPEGDAHLQEERRLCYVAMTRAKKTLILTSAADYGGARTRKVSRFVVESGLTAPLPVAKKRGNVAALQENHARPTTPAPSAKDVQWKIPSVYSFSQFRAFSTCPLQYAYAHVIKIPVPGKGHFTFGQAVHRSLYDFFKTIQEINKLEQSSLFDVSPAPALTAPLLQGVKVPPCADLLAIYERQWQNDWYRDEEEQKIYYQKGKDILEAVYKEEEKRGWGVPLGLEQDFTFKIGPYVFKGKIDRIDACEGGVEIVDYKTGQPKQKLTRDDKEQLFLYQLAMNAVPALRAFGHVQRLTFYYLDDGSRQSFLGTDEELAEFQERIQEHIAQLQKSDFTATPSRMVCGHCDFKQICPHREL